jgi:outer membrane protein, heavy metal efflux system
MSRGLAALALWSAISTASARAADEHQSSLLTLSLEEAMKRAERTVPEILTATSAIREAEATRVGAGIRLPVNPRLNVEGRRAIHRTQGPLGWAASGEITFEVADAASARLEEAARRVEMAASELGVSLLEARLLAFGAYTRTKLGQLRVEHARQALEIAERLMTVARQRLDAGAGSEIETTSAEVELAESRATLYKADAARNDAERELRFLLALPPEQPLSLSGTIEHPQAAPPVDVLIRTAERHRPDLQVIRDRIALLDASEVRLRREARPKVGLFGGVDSAPDSPLFGMVGLSIELAIAQRNQGPRAVTAAARETQRIHLDVQRRRVEHAVRATTALYDSQRAELETLVTKGVPAAQRRLAMVEDGWRAGRFDVLRVTAAAGDLVRLRERWAATLVQIWDERMLLERLIGTWPH